MPLRLWLPSAALCGCLLSGSLHALSGRPCPQPRAANRGCIAWLLAAEAESPCSCVHRAVLMFCGSCGTFPRARWLRTADSLFPGSRAQSQRQRPWLTADAAAPALGALGSSSCCFPLRAPLTLGPSALHLRARSGPAGSTSPRPPWAAAFLTRAEIALCLPLGRHNCIGCHLNNSG